MSYVTIEDRVDRLEALFGQFMTEIALLNKNANERNRAAEERQARFGLEMCQFKDEMREFKDEMREFKDEMREFKDEMSEFKDEMRASKRELDKKWGDLANKMGTIIEDILAPNLRGLAREHFRFETILDFMIRRSRRRPDRPEIESEFDTLVVGLDAVILGEAKSSPTLEYADAFADKLRSFFDFFPEYRGRRLIAVFGSWAIADPIVARLTTHGIYALRMGEDTMELANATALEGAGQ